MKLADKGIQSEWLVLGASRGLGAAFFQLLSLKEYSVVEFSRSRGQFDATQEEKWMEWLERWKKISPTRIVCFMGGGPYGQYGTKAFKDHRWAFRLNFEFPAFLLHSALTDSNWSSLKQICFIGSAIAEAKPDPLAASYAAAKHALCGLVTSIQRETHGSLDLRLFSPGFMDTNMLPKNAWPRHGGAVVRKPEQVAQNLLSWLQDSTCANQHQVFE